MSAQLDKLQAQYLFQRYKVKSLYVSVRKTVKQTPFAGLACFLQKAKKIQTWERDPVREAFKIKKV